MNVVIFEDEIHNFHLLNNLLKEMQGDCNVTGPLASIAEGRRFFAENKERIDLIIADIQLNDGLSFYALSEAPGDVPIIFTTAYDEYALRAFEYNSLSYLLKPVDEDELREAIRKTRERMITDEHREELFRILAGNAHYRERFIVKTFNGERVVSLMNVCYFVSEQKTTYLVLDEGTSYPIECSLSQLEEELNPNEFMRVNRKYIVPLSGVDGFEMRTNGKEFLRLKCENPPEIIVSRDNKENVHKRLRWT